MSFVRQSLRRKPFYGEINISPVSKHGRILSDEVYYQKRIKKSNNKQELSLQNDDIYIKKKELDHANYIERMMLEASSNKQQRRRSSNFSNNNSYHIDKLLEDENNDWFFEKILEKFEDLRSKRTDEYARPSSNDFDNDAVYGVERIIERRYYVKKSKLAPKRDQLTSTSDLTGHGKKNRQFSGVSSATTCSECSSSTPTYVENLRDQSNSLRNEISELKTEIEQLQTSQQEFFQQLRTYFPSKPTSSNFAPPTISPQRSPSDRNGTFGKPAVPPTRNQQSHATSDESDTSSIGTSSGKSTPVHQSTARPAAPPSIASIPRAPPIAEFMANKNPSIAPTPPGNTYTSSKPPSVVSTVPVNARINSKPLSIVRTPPVSEYSVSRNSINVSGPPTVAPAGSVSSRTSSVAPTPPVVVPVGSGGSRTSSVAPTPPVAPPIGSFGSTNSSITPNSLFTAPGGRAGSKTSSVAPTPPAAPPIGPFGSSNSSITPNPLFTAPGGRNGSKTSSVAPTPPAAPPIGPFGSSNSSITPNPLFTAPGGRNGSKTSSIAPTPLTDPSPMPSARMPIYENELAHRRVLSPRSQIVASSVSIQDSSDASSGIVSPDFIGSDTQKNSKVPVVTLRDNDMNDLARYSSQLELSGFPPSTTAVIPNPNASSTFWESVDQYIADSRPTNINTGLPPISRSNNGSGYGFNNNTTKQLDKYDLAIQPQGFIESSAPFLMPPLDTLP